MLKSKQIIRYTVSGERKEIDIKVELKQIDGLKKPGQNIWYGIATVDDKNFEHPSLKYCVNADYMVQKIAKEMIGNLRKEHGRKFRLKRK